MAQMVGTLPLRRWISDHYDIIDPRQRQDDNPCRCLRCDMTVTYLTKHAVNVHGDAIDIQPIRQDGVTDLDFDHEGRRVGVSR